MPLASKSHYRLDIEILRTVLYKTEERVVYHRFRFFYLIFMKRILLLMKSRRLIEYRGAVLSE